MKRTFLQEKAKEFIKIKLSQIAEAEDLAEEPETQESLKEDEFTHNSIIYKDSNFWQKYKMLADSVFKENNDKNKAKNDYYCQKFLENFLKKYVAYLPLCSSFVVGARDQLKRSNNGFIERYFGIKKQQVRALRKELGVLGNLKIGRYVEYQEEFVTDTLNTLALPILHNQVHKKHISKKKTTADEQAEELTQENVIDQEETWSRPRRIIKRPARFADADQTAALL